MGKGRVFITGGTGFLGSAIIRQLLQSNYEVMALRRQNSDMFRSKAYHDQVNWVNSDEHNYRNEVIKFDPEYVVHAAWVGVTAKERSDWSLQLKNFELLNDVLQICKHAAVKKIVVLGSQAEYGVINTKVDESAPAEGTDAYATCKLASQNILKAFCTSTDIDWYWLRVFSVFGPGEAQNWFIPWVIKNQLNNIDLDLTACEQKYDYLYIDDFAKMIGNIVSSDKKVSGVYNICSGSAVALKNIVELIRHNIGGKSNVNYGAIAYRKDQSMEISGDNSKYNANFAHIELTELSLAIKQTIEYYAPEFIGKNI